MKKILFTLLISCYSGFIVFAQDKQEEPVAYMHHVGAFGGAASGYGLSYRFFPGTFGFHVTTTPIFGSDHSHFSMGLEMLYSINKGRITHLYGYLANNYIYRYDKWENYSYSSSVPTTSYQTSRDITNISGIGVGFEICAGQRVGFNFQMGYGFYYYNKDDWNTGFDGGAGIYYKF